MVPLNEVKGQMKDKSMSVSHLNMPLSSWLKIPDRLCKENVTLCSGNAGAVMDVLFRF